MRNKNIAFWRRYAAPAMLLVLAVCSFCAPAHAQTDLPTVISPLKVDADPNGVNLTDGKITIPMPTLSVPADPRMTFDRIQNAAPYFSGKTHTQQEEGTLSAEYSVHYGGEASESFTCADSDCTSVTGTGSTFSEPLKTFRRSPSGEVYKLNVKFADTATANGTVKIYYASEIRYPDGEVLSFTYDTHTETPYSYRRPTRIQSNLGYYITISYLSSDFESANWGAPAVVGLYSVSDTVNPLAQFTYSGDTITDLAGRVYHCTGCANVLGSRIEASAVSYTLPTETSAAKQVTALSGAPGTGGVVGSVSVDGVTYNYAYHNLAYVSGWQFYTYDKVTVTGPNSYSKTYTINPATTFVRVNQLTGSTDELNHTTTIGYDSAFRPTSVTQPEGNSVSVGYDNYGNIISKVTTPKPGSGLTALTESAYVNVDTCTDVLCYRPVWYKDALNRQTDYIYNSLGQLTEQTDPADAAGVRRKTYIEYETHVIGTGSISRKKVVRVCGATTTCGTSAEIRTEYDYWGDTFLPSAERQIDGVASETHETLYTYDLAGHVLSVNGPLAGTDDTIYYAYDVLGRRTWEIGRPSSGSTRMARHFSYRDADDKVSSIETGTVTSITSPVLNRLNHIDTSYDAHRNPSRTALFDSGSAADSITDQAFNDRGQLECTAVRMNRAVYGSLPSSACTLGTTGSYGPDRLTHNVYDAAGRLLTVQKAYGVTTANGFPVTLQQDYSTFAYSANGKTVSMIDAGGNKASMTWDGFDRQTQWNFPSKTTPGTVSTTDYEAYTYDAAGNRLSLRKRDGSVIAYSYDNLDRVTLKDIPGGTAADVYYGYDIRGLQLYARFASASGAGIANSYDGFGRLTGTSNNMSGTARTLGYTYNAEGLRTRITHPDGVYFTYDRDVLGHTTAIKENGSTTIVSDVYDVQGRRTSETRGAVTTSYTYDAMSRPASLADDLAGTASDVTTTFNAYNPAGQLLGRTRSNDLYAFTGYPLTPISRSYTANGLNQYSAAGPSSFSYDANGNLTGDGSVTYTYDVENRMLTASGPAASTLSYDPLGRLWRLATTAKTIEFVYDGDALVYEINGTLIGRYVHGDGEDDPLIWYNGSGLTDRRSLQADHQGSIVSVADASGAALGINTYDQYGIWGSSPTGRFGYTGQAFVIQLGMYYYKARMYSPTLGRFLQTDPVGYADQNNLYAYVGNDPIDGRDPTGEQTAHADPDIVVQRRCASCHLGLPAPPPILRPPSLSWESFRRNYISIVTWVVREAICLRVHCASQSGAPSDAKDPDGAKAPGKPGEAEGFKDPKTGEKWGKAPNGKSGWVDDKGNVWVPTGPDGSPNAHGGKHWDVQFPNGGYSNVYPDGHTRWIS